METIIEKMKKESKTGLTSGDLVNHIFKNHKIDIQDGDSVTLLNMGYYHGYKRYRFVKKSNSDGILPLSSFKEIEAIYNFDMELKGLFYPIVMLVETALKIGLSIQ